MRYAALFFLAFTLLGTAQNGENVWRGDLVDWQCKQADSSQPCPVSAATKQFALSGDGGVLMRLDAKGNELAAAELRRSGAGGTVEVSIETYEERDVDNQLKVKSVKITQSVTR